MSVSLREHPFRPWQELADYEAAHAASLGSFGATAVFVGTMRDFNEDERVTRMHLEHYPGMTEKHLQAIHDEAMQNWPLQAALIVHRVGDVVPGEAIVLVAAWSAHRAAAFDATRFIMEDLKSRAPFWKKETLVDDATRWVEKNTPGYSN